MRFLILVLAGSIGIYGVNLPKIPKLSDLVNPFQQFKLKDILSTLTALDTPDIAADSAGVSLPKHEYTDRLSSISDLNRSKRDLLFQGDIHLSFEHLSNIVREQLDHSRTKRTAFRNAMYPKTIWLPNVPFELHGSLSAKSRSSLVAAMAFWEKHTCVAFKKRTSEKVYLLMSGQEEGCWSTVGRDEAQGAQILNIGTGCEMFGITSHEIAHALGLFHEQSRYDRDNYVQIVKSRIAQTNFYDFAVVGKKNMETYGQKYDIGSVMHYRPTEFSLDGGNSIIAKDVNMQNTMGQFRGPSFIDVAKINRHYNCEKNCKNKITCLNGGYQHPKNCKICVCPPGYGGSDCKGIEASSPAKCTGVLVAGETQRKFTANIKPNKNAKGIRKCNYHIEAPPGKRIVIIVDSVIGNCVQGCYEEGVELKMYEDKTVTGARFCCKLQKPQTLISQGNTVPLMLVAGKAQAFVQLRYSTVDGPQNRSPKDGNATSIGVNPFLLEKYQDNSIDSEAIRKEYHIQSDNVNQEDFETLVRSEFIDENTADI
ncbi:Zinc metalloproteinase nas-23 [Caenorhabditis elegans]|uniref:Zinc metalloproteinase nas-23 n=1 Tax=Caenorhabditis elegans TaxID=6239 RepID=NAS23_CAEEL|nr:Zinc metalloproteinase nas-23 [Caenorhabditis elegans]Q7Z0M7.3 RecName: Full=Zinc metalloproteinase nas-23; AltName: Full=Nematode astacin 23; Flags: Precursor [Caenorhabditis elegans]CCD65953.1 Zinc metalloproteinase nas-23 [Caenorhabditis elegans]|eukprot:NP_001022281.1 Zinc metalloproteinase nas-23 [Caenorhabditis elegans]